MTQVRIFVVQAEATTAMRVYGRLAAAMRVFARSHDEARAAAAHRWVGRNQPLWWHTEDTEHWRQHKFSEAHKSPFSARLTTSPPATIR